MESPSQPQYSIEVRNLTRFYGATAAVRELSFEVRPGEVVGFLGPNGAGKSTTLRILSGLLSASSGEAWIMGVPVARQPDAIKSLIGYMPENNPLPEDLRIQEYLTLRARLKGIPSRKVRQRVDDVVERCDLGRKNRRKLIGTLSKGFRQRVGIADALLSQPAVTILDEPTIGLDPHQVLLIRELIQSLRGSTTVILSSHILDEVEKSCDRVLILNQGILVASGTPAELRREFTGAQIYRVETAADAELLLSVMQAVDPTCRVISQHAASTDGFVIFEISSSQNLDQADALLRTLANSHNLRLRSFQKLEPRLEEVFLVATRRSWEVEKGVRS